MHFFKAGFVLILLAALVACTPAYTRQKTAELATQVRLRDGVDIQRTSERLLSRQAQVCLVSDASGTAAGAELLRSAQAGLNGYFLAVGVESEPMDYLRAVANPPCPSAEYLFYVQPVGQPVCIGDDQQCSYPSFQYTITVVSNGDHSLVDRVTVAIKTAFISDSRENAQRVQAGFAQLAGALTGVDSH